MPLDLRRGVRGAQREAARARALAVIVGDRRGGPARRRRRRRQPARAARRGLPRRRRRRAAARCTRAPALGHRRRRGASRRSGSTRRRGWRSSGRSPRASLLMTALATLRAGGALVDGGRARRQPAVGLVRRAGGARCRVARRWRRVRARGPVGDGDLAELRHAFASARIGRALDTGEALRVAAAEGTRRGARCPTDRGGMAARPLEVRSPTAMLGYLDDAAADHRRLRRARRQPLRARLAARSRRRPRSSVICAIRPACAKRRCSPCARRRRAAARLRRRRRGRRRCRAIPARVVTLESLPHRADGAIDRAALRRMAAD